MGNYKFYTPPLLADALLQLLPKRKFENVIDICCGSWNLLRAAHELFSGASYLGVDTDIEARNSCLKGAKFLCEDGRKFSCRIHKKYDLILSNPPFGHITEKERFYKDDKKCVIQGLNNKRYENEMVLANLNLSKEKGVLLFILPSTFFEGVSYLQVRKELYRYFTIKSIIKLPMETFGNNRVSTYALILVNTITKKQKANFYEASLHAGQWSIQRIHIVKDAALKNGLWTEKRLLSKNMDKKVKILRGNISTAFFSKQGKIVLHCSSCSNECGWAPSVRYCNDLEKLKNAKKALVGDIIINRIGRHAGYWCKAKTNSYVSDCLFVIRNTDKTNNIYNKLNSNSVNGKLNVKVKGVTTHYITMHDIRGVL